jgi:gluconokinase
VIIVMMGPAGSGKTTVGRLLSSQLGCEFVDGDIFHSAANVHKMKQGIPLDDTDRTDWLNAIRLAILEWIASRRTVVLACSALKDSYRKRLLIGADDVRFVYLKVDCKILQQRLRSRQGHFADMRLLASQLADLEDPIDAITVDANGSPEQILAEVRDRVAFV